MSTQLDNNFSKVRAQILAAEKKFDRTAYSVNLIAVSKKQPINAIQNAIAYGQYDFGESYLQEALAKIAILKDPKIIWHYIGAMQSNKTKTIAENFAWIHSVDRLKIAERLSLQRPIHLPPLNICIEVNIDQEPNKSGVSLNDLTSLAADIAKLPNLKLRGLMAIPAPRKTFDEQRQPFHQLRLAFASLQAKGLQLDTLSMGMSDDFEAAIAEGATMVRIGNAIFGERK